MAARSNALDQSLDIAGSSNKSSTSTLSDEVSGFGKVVAGQFGSAATLGTVTSGLQLVTGLTGMSVAAVGDFLVISGASSLQNNGEFQIVNYINATSVQIRNAGTPGDANNGSIAWTQRRPYSLEDDFNFIRTDRAAIKGTEYSDGIPTYQRPTAVGTHIPANLLNVSGRTTDAMAMVTTKRLPAVMVSSLSGFVTVTSSGNLKYAMATDRTGVPINDGYDVGNDQATYVDIINPSTGTSLDSIVDPTKRIFGRTRQGSAVSPNTVEIEFRQVTKGLSLLASTSYVWEIGQPTSVDMYYGYRERLDNINESAIRSNMTNGILGGQDLGSITGAKKVGFNPVGLTLTSANNVQDAIYDLALEVQGGADPGAGSDFTESAHRTVRQLIHFVSEGPAEGFGSGAYKETLPSGNPFPTSMIWWSSSARTSKIVEKTISYNSNKTFDIVTWHAYLSDGYTVAGTIQDNFSYLGVVETTRTRTIVQSVIPSNDTVTKLSHRTLNQLIHFISEGPAEGFTTGAFREMLPSGNPFPTSIVWWESNLKLKKIVEKEISYNLNKTPSVTIWKVYDSDGATIDGIVTDTHSYSGIIETSRTRSIG